MGALQILESIDWQAVSIVKLPRGIELRPCANTDSQFIRSESRANFFDVISRTIGWDEEAHQRQPEDPHTYRIVYVYGERIGFLRLREDPESLYLSTLQLLPAYRGQGIGTLLLAHVEAVAKSAGAPYVRLHVFEDHPARSLYERLGYVLARRTEFGRVLEKRI
ncbi:MAG: GNAT family N-acetyltransferase [Planctomycetota bacterium]